MRRRGLPSAWLRRTLGLSLLLASCGAWQDDPCQGVQCSGHGRCVEQSGQATCACDPGYQARARECIPEPDECADVTCSHHGTCAVLRGQAVCRCDPGFQARELQCIPSLLPCSEPCGPGVP